MQRVVAIALMASACSLPANAQPAPSAAGTGGQRTRPAVSYPAPARDSLGGGFIEALFGAGPSRVMPAEPRYYVGQPYGVMPAYARTEPVGSEAARYEMSPVYRRQMVEYAGGEQPGTVIIDTPNRFLYLVQDGGRALRYGIGVGRPGFTWAGIKHVSAKREWPDWTPPAQMLQRRPDLPRYMAGGPDNPLGARAMYLGNTLYRIHGSNEPWTIGTQVSSGCIRMRNEDVIDLYDRVKVGTKVGVI